MRSRSRSASSKLLPTKPLAVLQALTARPAYADLATLIAMAEADEVVRLRLLQAIRDMTDAT